MKMFLFLERGRGESRGRIWTLVRKMFVFFHLSNCSIRFFNVLSPSLEWLRDTARSSSRVCFSNSWHFFYFWAPQKKPKRNPPTHTHKPKNYFCLQRYERKLLVFFEISKKKEEFAFCFSFSFLLSPLQKQFFRFFFWVLRNKNTFFFTRFWYFWLSRLIEAWSIFNWSSFLRSASLVFFFFYSKISVFTAFKF